jgi:glycosyltransferase involved in cell wall biosynthesis
MRKESLNHTCESTDPQPGSANVARQSGPSRQDKPTVSIILCTCGLRPLLVQCLEGLTAQARQYPDCEIIVVINGPKGSALVEAIAQFPVRLLNEPKRGVSIARNHAVSQAKGDILIFVDDDILVSPGWLEEIVKGFQDPQVCCVTGRVIPAGPLSLTRERSNRYYTSERALTNWTLDTSDPDWYQHILGEPVGFGCNMAFRRDFLENYSLFPPDLGAGSLIGGGDEFYMYLQVMKRGFRILHNPAAAVTHVFDADIGNQKTRAAQLYAGSVAFALKLLLEEKTLRMATTRWLFSGLKRRAGHIWKRKAFTSEPQELLSPREKFFAYVRGLGVYLRARRARNSRGETRRESR